jgi:hypothetical protein
MVMKLIHEYDRVKSNTVAFPLLLKEILEAGRVAPLKLMSHMRPLIERSCLGTLKTVSRSLAIADEHGFSDINL